MHARNEAYQYAWGCTLAEAEQPRADRGARPRLQQAPPADRRRRARRGRRWRAGTLAATLNGGLPRRRLRPQIGHGRSKLAAIAEPVRAARRIIVVATSLVHRQLLRRRRSISVDAAVVKSAARKYSKAIAEHFVNAERGRWIYGYSTAVGGTAALIPTMAAAPIVGLLAGLAISIVAAFGDQVGIPEAMMKIVDGKRGKMDYKRCGAWDAAHDGFELPDRPAGRR